MPALLTCFRLFSPSGQVLMIDDRNNVAARRVGVHNRLSESIPDYEDVKVRRETCKFFDINTQTFLNILGRLLRRFGYFYS